MVGKGSGEEKMQRLPSSVLSIFFPLKGIEFVRCSDLGTSAFAERLSVQDFYYIPQPNENLSTFYVGNFFASPQASFLWFNERSALISDVGECSLFYENKMELSVTHVKQL